jgi:indolepyruvate ferredoxin oxidoreductase beta subunit
MKTINILIVGVGGQGTLLTSRIIGNLALSMGYDVKMSEVHGMAQRGGSVVTHVRFGRKIHSPLVEPGSADIILAFERLETLRWLHYAREDGTIIINDQAIDPMPVIMGISEYPSDITEKIGKRCNNMILIKALDIAKELGNIKVFNTVLLGVLASKLEIDASLWLKAIEESVPPKTIEVNKQAFLLGFQND